MAKKIAIIGAGPGGYVAGLRAAQLGLEVTVIEQDKVGGTCLNWGCIPSKVMKATADILEKFRSAKTFGIRADQDANLDMAGLMSRKQNVIQSQAKGIHALFKKQSIRYLQGQGHIRGQNMAEVRHADGQTTEVPWDKLILAMGSRPLEIPAFPFDGKRILSSNHALSLQEIPESLLIVGGGVIGCEFAFIFSAFGANVTVVEALPRLLPLPSVDADCSKILQREMKKRKISFMLETTVDTAEIRDGKVLATLRAVGDTPKAPTSLEADKMLVCIGRKPNTDNMGLENIGISLDEKGWITANDQMETNVPDVYAIGDVLGPSRAMLAHVASAEGMAAAENAMGQHREMRYDAVPGGIFTMPEVANVGLTEEQASEAGYAVRGDSVLFRALGKAHVIGEIAGEAKIVSDAETGKILGVHIVGPHATDLIAEGTLAIQTGATVRELAETIHAHPTLAEIMAEAAFKATDQSLHG